MNTKFAECSENQSGQRFLNGSAPRLIRHAASCKTAGGESNTLPAGKDQKPLRGVGWNPTLSARAARVPSLASQAIESTSSGLRNRYSGMCEANRA